MNLADLITDSGTGQLSHTKLWANIGLAVVTLALIALTVKIMLTPMQQSSLVFFDAYGSLMLIYLALVCTNAAASKALSLGMGKGELK